MRATTHIIAIASVCCIVHGSSYHSNTPAPHSSARLSVAERIENAYAHARKMRTNEIEDGPTKHYRPKTALKRNAKKRPQEDPVNTEIIFVTNVPVATSTDHIRESSTPHVLRASSSPSRIVCAQNSQKRAQDTISINIATENVSNKCSDALREQDIDVGNVSLGDRLKKMAEEAEKMKRDKEDRAAKIAVKESVFKNTKKEPKNLRFATRKKITQIIAAQEAFTERLKNLATTEQIVIDPSSDEASVIHLDV